MARGPRALTGARTPRIALIAVLAVAGASPAPAIGDPLVPPPAYYRPIVAEGFTFPVARTNWLSVIELAKDWHAPRMRLIDGQWQQVGRHEGNDITAEKGTPVLSMTAGTVEAVGWTFYSGTRVGVRGTDGRYYFYAHLSAVAPGRAAGQSVRMGTVLGRVGNTGYGPPGHEDEFPPHLHVGIRDADWVNPYPLIRRLYKRSVRATLRAERRLAALARAGDEESFDRLAARLYADL